ncbi:hypothetical protein [Quadrisphaera granulorum]|nr:hypothetical protein [Quadrisphaera granulorum]
MAQHSILTRPEEWRAAISSDAVVDSVIDSVAQPECEAEVPAP